MSTRSPPSSLLSLLLLLLRFSFLAASSEACGISVYWGQNKDEGSLREACDSNVYKYIPIAFLTDFGSDSTPILNLSGHCDPAPSGTCTYLRDDIKYCQSLGIKLLLSLGGNDGIYNLSSPEDARKVASYLWDNYLAGTGGPLGEVALDGIDFYIEYAESNLYWDELVRALAAYSTPERKVYLSAAPLCYFPDYFLDTAIKTGLFDYVWVRYYDSPMCDFNRGFSFSLSVWDKWSEFVGNYSAETKLFLGFPAAEEAAARGYIKPSFAKDILGTLREKPNYGGVMLWNRYYDYMNRYSVLTNFPNEAVCTGEERFISQVV